MKYTVPPEILLPVPGVGEVRPGPLVGTPCGALALLPEPEPEPELLLEPHALTPSAISAVARMAGTLRRPPCQ